MKSSRCLVAKVHTGVGTIRTKHYVGLPPEVASGIDDRQEREAGSVLIIEEKNGGFFLFRYTLKGKCVGDTWHKSLDEAKEQAEFEFSSHLSSWKEVPEDVQDKVSFALK